MNDIAEEEGAKEEDDEEEGNNDGEAGVGVNLGWGLQVKKEQELEGVKPRNLATRPDLLFLVSIIVLFMTGVVSIFPKQDSASFAPLHQAQKLTVAQVSLVPRGENEFSRLKNKDNPPPVDPAAPGSKSPNVVTPTVMNKATPASSPKSSRKQKIWAFRKQQKWSGAEDVSMIAASKTRLEPISPSVPMRDNAQPTPLKNVWHHVRDAMQRLINFRMLGVLLGYTLLFSFLV